MVRRQWALVVFRIKRARQRIGTALGRIPALRRIAPWGLAIGLNVGLAILLLSLPFARVPKGLPDAPDVVSVFIVPPEPPPLLEPEPLPEKEEPEAPPPELEEIVAEETPQDEAEDVLVADAPPPALPEMEGYGIKLPEVALPTTEIGRGAPDGLVALSCNDQFKDPQKAAECAGRIVRSGWKANIAELGPEWEEIAKDLRRGGYDVPSYGPDALAGLGRDSFVFQADDPRYRYREFDRWGRYTRSFESPSEYRKFQRLKDSRRYQGDGDGVRSGWGIEESVPISGWQPSWQLRDDPNIDRRELDALVREALEQEE